jgi:NADH dehydrogenase FAD-containing subunit
MNKDTKVKVVEVEEKTLQEKEKELQKKAGAIFEDGVYKVNLKDAVQKQSTDEVSLRSTPESSEKVQ